MSRLIRLLCGTCKKEFYRSVYVVRNAPCKFCSVKCKTASQDFKGVKNPRWNGGKTMHEAGYVLVKAPMDHPYKTKAGYIREHRLVMERFLGRYLDPSEDVHHKNHIKTDNRIENLELFSNRSVHLEEEHKSGTYIEHLQQLNNRRHYA